MAAAKVFWDTNILVDIVDGRQYELEATHSIFAMAISKEIQLFVSEEVIATALYISISPNVVEAILQVLKAAEVLPSNTSIVRTALISTFKDKEDAMLYHLALHHHVDFFITRDKKDFAAYASALLPVFSPAEFMTSIK